MHVIKILVHIYHSMQFKIIISKYIILRDNHGELKVDILD